MTNNLRWGFLSAGGIADEVAKDFAIAGLEIRAVGARDKAKADAFADKFNIPNRYQGYDDLVNDSEVDVVYVSTIHPMHHQHAKLALNAGKHVLLEKPFTINAQEARDLQQLAQSKGLFIMEAMWSRFLPSMDAIFKVINSGRLGEIQLVIADHSQYLPTRARMTELELGGGALMDLGIYPVSFAHRIFGAPKKITSSAKMTQNKVDSSTSMIFDYESGAQASLTTCFFAAGPVNAVVMGTEARIEVNYPFYNQTSFKVIDNKKQVVETYDEKISGVGRQYQAIHVQECIASGLTSSPVMSVAESVEIMGVMDQVKNQIGLKYLTE